MKRKLCSWWTLLAITLILCGSSHASTTASITVNGGEQPGDSSSISVTFNGFTETVHYGAFSTEASVASALAGMFSRDYLQAGLCAAVASPGGNVINFKLRGGTAFGALDVTGSTNSFNMASSGFASQGSSSIYDTGTVTLTVGGQVAAQTNYGEGATPDSIAEGLAKAASGSYVNVTAVGNTIYFQATPNYAGTDYSFSLTSQSTNGFSSPSFNGSPASGDLEGGSGAGGSPQTVYSYSASYDIVGNVTSLSDNSYNGPIMGTWSMASGNAYDHLNRLTAAQATAGPYQGIQASWSYDSFGNRTAETFSGSSNMPMPTSSSSGYNANNQIESSSLQMGGSGGAPIYDEAGDVMQDNQNKYLYDPEGQICATENLYTGALTGYLYDAEGVRVAKGNISNLSSCDPAANGFQLTQAYVIGQSNEQMSEYDVDDDGSIDWQHTNVWMGGTLLATYLVAGPPLPNPNDPGNPFPNSTLHFYFNDPLGTRRAQTDYSGAVEQTCSSLPFGDGAFGSEGTCIPQPTEHLFTGKERDTESGLDYFGARYYGSSMGRFMSPDPENFGANIMNPQSWNMYSYAMNNPLINIDPDGRECVWDDGSYDSGDDPDTGSADKCSGQGGTWISNDIFENSQYYRGDWSGAANGTLSGLVGDIQSCSAAVGGGQAASLIVADSFASGFSNDQTAYALGTASYESGPGGIGSNMTEMGSPSYFSQYDGRMGNTSLGDGYTYRGRGYVQLTGKWSYNYWTNQIGQNLVQHPSLAATPDAAAEIMVEGFDRGSFRRGNSIQDYVNSSGSNFVGARAVVNGGGDQAQTIANAATGFSNSMSGCRQ